MTQIAQITGGAANQTASGWLKPCFPHQGKAHHFTRIKGMGAVTSQGRAFYWESLCGIDTISTERAPMFEPGNWDRCKKCEKQLARRAAA